MFKGYFGVQNHWDAISLIFEIYFCSYGYINDAKNLN